MPTPYVNLLARSWVTGDSISFEDWLAAIRNPLAIAEGASGAPRIVVPTALSTAEMDTGLVLKPDGTGGLVFGSAFTGLRNSNGSGNSSISGMSAGVWEFAGWAQHTSPSYRTSFSGVITQNGGGRIEQIESTLDGASVTLAGDLTTNSFALPGTGMTVDFSGGTLSTSGANRSWLRASRVG